MASAQRLVPPGADQTRVLTRKPEDQRRGRGKRGDAAGAIKAVPSRVSASARVVPIPSGERQELLCSVIGLTVKLGIGLVAGVSLTHLASAYQQRLDRHSEVSAILELETARLRRAQNRFDKLFSTEGQERLMREQEQWIAPDRLRVVWEAPQQPAKLQSQL